MTLLPAVLRNWRGFFLPGGTVAAPTAIVVIDYQNIHLTARDQFAPPGTPAEDVLIHPLRFAEQVLATRHNRLVTKAMATAGSDPVQQVELVGVEVYRGQPSNEKNPRLYRFTQAQRSEWTRDRRVKVDYRTLRYRWERGFEVAQEKGIDVRVALAVVRAVTTRAADIVILATHDTDLEPAIEMAVEWGGATVETAGWDQCRILRPRGITRQRHASLDGAAMLRSRDRKVYERRSN